MHRTLIMALFTGILFLVHPPAALAQETPTAKATRQRLKQKITIELKEIGTKAFFDEIKREMDKPVSFKIDNTTGISNNTKMTLIAKDQTVEKILNDLMDKYDFGWFVMSSAKDRYDGWIVIRKSKEKERGYEAGKGPKAGGNQTRLLPPPEPNRTLQAAPSPSRRYVRLGVSGSGTRFRIIGVVR
jgi:hypothetical protein